MDLRCENKLHGHLDDSVIEVKCNSRFCGAGGGVVVLHRFDATNGTLIETLTFRDTSRKETQHGRQCSSVRSA